MKLSGPRQPVSMLPLSCAPSTLRSELVVCEATIRFSELAPLSVKPACVEVEACRRANGVTDAPVQLPSPSPSPSL